MDDTSTVDLLMQKAFSKPRALRSNEYKAGVRWALMSRICNTKLSIPHQPGTAEWDAFSAGTDEGVIIFRKYELEEGNSK